MGEKKTREGIPGLADLACPACRGVLAEHGPGVICEGCGAPYPSRREYLDLVVPGTPEPRGLAPRMMQMPALSRIYERLWRPAFVAVASRGRPDFDRELEHIGRFLGPADGGTLVDLSCGPGMMGRRLAQTGRYRRVWGLDLSAAMLDQARALSAAEDVSDFPLVRADVARLPFRDGALDGAHAGAALHMWPSVERGLAEAGRVLRPGGVLVCSTFVHPRGLRILGPAESAVHRTIRSRIFAWAELRGALEEAGFDAIEKVQWGSWSIMSATRG